MAKAAQETTIKTCMTHFYYLNVVIIDCYFYLANNDFGCGRIKQ